MYVAETHIIQKVNREAQSLAVLQNLLIQIPWLCIKTHEAVFALVS